MTLETIKDQYAKEKGFDSWVEVSPYLQNIDEIAKRYAKAKLEEAAENTPSIRDMFDEGTGRMYSEEKRTVFVNGGKYVREQFKESITNINLD